MIVGWKAGAEEPSMKALEAHNMRNNNRLAFAFDSAVEPGSAIPRSIANDCEICKPYSLYSDEALGNWRAFLTIERCALVV